MKHHCKVYYWHIIYISLNSFQITYEKNLSNQEMYKIDKALSQ